MITWAQLQEIEKSIRAFQKTTRRAERDALREINNDLAITAPRTIVDLRLAAKDLCMELCDAFGLYEPWEEQ